MSGTPAAVCPCGRPDARGRALALADCCGRYLDGGAPVPDAQALMRSRYTAFVLGRVDWLLATWHPDTRPRSLELAPGVRWLGLQVRQHRVLDATHEEVSFVARSRHAGGRAERLSECSRFVRVDGRWLYLDGDVD